MCGISGLINKNLNKIDMVKVIKDMTNIIIHRGPDGEGYYIKNNIALGHRRLSIIDLRKKSNQPFLTNKYVLIFNGEIYNYKELKKQLKRYKYVTKTDTEVILAAYEEWGEKCVNYFRGMWAFTLYDIDKNIIFCSRDRFGIKPLYYRDTENYFAFASEIKQFTVLPQWEAIGNRDRIQDFFIFGVLDHTDETMFKGVKQLRPGHNLIYELESNKYKIFQYYDLGSNIKNINEENSAEKLRELLEKSIEEHLIGDVQIGSCLSGGLDSSTIVVIMNKILKQYGNELPIHTVSSCFKNKKYDEQEYIDEVANKVNAKQHKVYPDDSSLFKDLDKLIWHQDEPFGSTSIFAQWKVFQEANDNKIKVMLDGQGADEQLAGYPSFYIAYLNELFLKVQWKRLKKEKEHLLNGYNYFDNNQLFERTIKNHITPLKRVLKKRLNRKGRFSRPNFETYFSYYKKLNDSMKSMEKFSLHQLYFSSLPQLLHYEDRNSMAHFIESRVPFLDHRIVEYTLSLKSSEKIKNGTTKYILRKAMKEELPDKVIDRRDKMGFVTPEVIWIRDNKEIFRKYFLDGCNRLGNIIETQTALEWFDKQMKSDESFDFTIWRIVCISKWMEIFKVGDIE